MQGASASVYALLACNAVVDPYRRFVWLFGLQLNSLGCVPASAQDTVSVWAFGWSAVGCFAELPSGCTGGSQL